MTIITTGDDAAIPVTCKKDGATFVVSGSAVVKAVLTGMDRQTVISPEVTIDKGATGTDLANSKLIVEFTEVQTALISEIGAAYLELQIADPLKSTWSKEVLVRNGNIA